MSHLVMCILIGVVGWRVWLLDWELRVTGQLLSEARNEVGRLTERLDRLAPVLLVLVLPGLAWGATYDISPTGTDTAACTAEAPCATLKQACTLVKPGDTVQFQAGIYGLKGAIGCPVNGASWEQPVTLRSAPEAIVTFVRADPATPAQFTTGQTRDVPRYLILQGSVDPETGARRWRFDGVTISGQGDLVRLQDLEVHHNRATSSLPGGNALQLLNLHVHHNGNGSLSHGWYTHTSDSLVEGGEWSHHNGYAIHLYNNKQNSGACTPGVRETGATPKGCGVLNNTIRGVYLHHNGGGIIVYPGADNWVYSNHLAWQDGAGLRLNSLRSKLYGNLAYRNNRAQGGGSCPQSQFHIAALCDDCEVVGNLAYGSHLPGLCVEPGAERVRQQGNLWGTVQAPLGPRVTP